ncbi:hypothetical protein QKV95_gp004 [Poseidoniales virus YSH_150918]|jgi:hypothetical protein|uniref:Uncharacterized protein n=1 Tax=Poseidoniales virus YSH_150918 TaxID=3071324 RepID=A0A976UAT7_9CAUD|nr:hypothetical protein QKV95_gp004 [Yangshan Harbor Poseidoniales virus]UVF62478.1 hypothetical protein [Poseidoniales virus YSH_150918]
MCDIEGLTDEEILNLVKLRIRCKEWLSLVSHWVEKGTMEQLSMIEDKLESIIYNFQK